MWTIGDDDGDGDRPGATATRPDCPGCGEPDLHGDDFCHECGHSFEHLAAGGGSELDEEADLPCPMCATGQLMVLEYGRTQCDSCGYTSRDEG